MPVKKVMPSREDMGQKGVGSNPGAGSKLNLLELLILLVAAELGDSLLQRQLVVAFTREDPPVHLPTVEVLRN